MLLLISISIAKLFKDLFQGILAQLLSDLTAIHIRSLIPAPL